MRKIQWVAAIAVMLSVAVGALVTSTWGTSSARVVAAPTTSQFDALEAMSKAKGLPSPQYDLY
jgi:hypothetical protein